MIFDKLKSINIDMIGMASVAFLADKLDISKKEVYIKLHEEKDSMSAKLLATMWQVNLVLAELEEEKRQAEEEK